MRLAQPAIAALHALGAASSVEPCVILSHEYMGMPTALAAILEGEQSNFRTIFYAHEVATMRRIVEGHPGHDTMFYNVMRSGDGRRGITSRTSSATRAATTSTRWSRPTRFCDDIFAVGDYTLKEIRFLGPDFVARRRADRLQRRAVLEDQRRREDGQPQQAAAVLQDPAEVRAGLRLHARDAARAQQGPVARPARARAPRAQLLRSATRRPCCSR